MSTTKLNHRRMTPNEVANIAKAYRAGASTYELAEILGVHRHTVVTQLKKVSVPLRRRPLSKAEVEEAATLYASGLSLVTLAKQLGRNRTGVANALKRAGVQLRSRPGWNYG